jgi:hypothetical protein
MRDEDNGSLHLPSHPHKRSSCKSGLNKICTSFLLWNNEMLECHWYVKWSKLFLGYLMIIRYRKSEVNSLSSWLNCLLYPLQNETAEASHMDRGASLLFCFSSSHTDLCQAAKKRFLLANDITWPLLLTSIMAGRLQEHIEKYNGERSITAWGRCCGIHLWVPFLCHSIG